MATFSQATKARRQLFAEGVEVYFGWDDATGEIFDSVGDGQGGNYAIAEAKVAEIVVADAVEEAKLVGFDYNGTMVSATSDDQNGLAAVFIAISNGFTTTTNFHFSNGSVLAIDATVLADFAPVWSAFRNSFRSEEAHV